MALVTLKLLLPMGLSSMLFFVLTLTWRTCPLLSGMVSSIFSMSQEFRGDVSSTMRTTSLGTRFFLILFHFCLSCSKGRYSRFHLFQKRLARYWTCLHLLLEYEYSLLNKPGGIMGFPFSCSRWFGIRASKSFGSSDTVVMGRTLRMASTSHRAETLIIQSLLAQHWIQHFLYGTYQSLPNTRRWIKRPLDSFIEQCMLDLTVVQISKWLL